MPSGTFEGIEVAVTSLEGARIAILVQNLPVPFDRRVWQEATSLHAAGADVTVVCPSDDRHPAGEFSIDGVTVLRYRAPAEAKGILGYVNEYGLSLTRMSAAFKRALKDGPFDVVHFCNPPDLLYRVAKRAKRRDGSVLVFDQHDLGPELVEAKHMPLTKLLVFVARQFERRTYAWADHVISTNESYKEIAESRGGFAPDEVTVIRSGPYRSWADETSNSPQADERWRNGRRFLIGYVGVMGRQEGIEYLIDAVDILSGERGIDVQLALVGSGPDRDRLEAISRERGLGGRVAFLGRLSDEDLRSVLASADVCVNPDEVNKMNDLSTMNKIIEYMALGCPDRPVRRQRGKVLGAGRVVVRGARQRRPQLRRRDPARPRGRRAPCGDERPRAGAVPERAVLGDPGGEARRHVSPARGPGSLALDDRRRTQRIPLAGRAAPPTYQGGGRTSLDRCEGRYAIAVGHPRDDQAILPAGKFDVPAAWGGDGVHIKRSRRRS